MPDAQTLTSIVIYGATGDLTRHKLLPALYMLFTQDKLPARPAPASAVQVMLHDCP